MVSSGASCLFLLFLVVLFGNLSYGGEVLVSSGRADTINQISGITTRYPSPSELETSPLQSFPKMTRTYAQRTFRKGEIVLTLGNEDAITYKSILSKLPELGTTVFSYLEEPYVIWYLHQKAIGVRSEYQDFVEQVEDIQPFSPLSWDKWASFGDDLSERLARKASSELNVLTSHFQKANSKVFSKFPELFPKKVTLEEYLSVYSKLLHFIQKTPSGDYQLYPNLSFSHSPSAFPIVFNDEGELAVIAAKDIEVGEEIFIKYGNITNEELFYQYGSYYIENPYDCVPFRIAGPYWRFIAQYLFNATSNDLSGCLGRFFQPSNEEFIYLRHLVATTDELNAVSLQKLRSGEPLSLDNEFRVLRALYTTVSTQAIQIKENEANAPDTEYYIKFVSQYSQLVRTVGQRVVDLWRMYLQTSLQ